MVDKIPSNKIGGVNQAGKASAPKTTDSDTIAGIQAVSAKAAQGTPTSVKAALAVLEFAGHRKAA